MKMYGLNEASIPFGTFAVGDKVKITYNKNFYKLGTGIGDLVTVEKTISNIRGFKGVTYVAFTDGLEINVMELENMTKVTNPGA